MPCGDGEYIAGTTPNDTHGGFSRAGGHEHTNRTGIQSVYFDERAYFSDMCKMTSPIELRATFEINISSSKCLIHRGIC